MDHTNIKSIGEIYSDIQEAYTVQGKARIGSTAAKATDSSVSSAVDKALANKGTAVSASSEKGKTGVTGSGSFRMSGSLGGGSNKAKPTPTPTSGGSRPKPTSSTSRSTPQSGSSSTRADTRSPGASSLGGGMSIGRGGGGGMMRSETTSDLDTYNLVLEYLLDEGFASTEQSADKIILNMSEAWFADIMEITGGKGHPGYKAGSKDHGDLEDHPAAGKKGGVLSPRYGNHLGDMDDEDEDEDDLESVVKQQSRDRRETVRKPLRDKVKAARKKMTKEEAEYVDENRRAARSAGGYKDDSKKQTDPSKDGFTGIGNMTIKDIMALNKKIEARTKKEEFELWVNSLLDEGYDLSEYTWDEMYDIFVEAAPIPRTDVRYDKHMKRMVPTGGVPVPRASKKPTTQMAGYEPEGENIDEGREEDAKKSLDAVKKRQGVLDDHEKKTGKKLDITKTPEYKSHKQNFPGAKRTGKKERGAKETPDETHRRRVNKTVDRIVKKGYTSKEKKEVESMAKHTSPRD